MDYVCWQYRWIYWINLKIVINIVVNASQEKDKVFQLDFALAPPVVVDPLKYVLQNKVQHRQKKEAVQKIILMILGQFDT